MKEAQRFPDDYDGIIAGAPGLDWIACATLSMWVAQAVHKNEASYIPPREIPLPSRRRAECMRRRRWPDRRRHRRSHPLLLRSEKPSECKGPDETTCLTAPCKWKPPERFTPAPVPASRQVSRAAAASSAGEPSLARIPSASASTISNMSFSKILIGISERSTSIATLPALEEIGRRSHQRHGP